MYSQYYQYPPQPQPARSYPAYPTAAYPPAPPPQTPAYPAYAPAPPDPRMMSEEEFRRFFLSRLSELVVNQKNIIHNLAFIANDNVHRFPHLVAECIETHIRRAHPQVKLPAWYLLDSIAKNIGQPYTRLFTEFVGRLFLDSYHAVDLPTRSKMEEMLVTWRTGGPGGRELFGVDVQSFVEKAIWSAPVSDTQTHSRGSGKKRKGRTPTHRPQSSSSSNRQTGPTKAQVLTELEVILAQKSRAVEINPYDDVAQTHLDTLVQLRSLVQTSVVTPEELSAILTQLRNLARTTASSAPPLPPMVPPPPATYPAPQVAPAVPGYPPAALPAAYPSVVNVSSAQTVVLPQGPVAPAAASDIGSLFQSLVNAGVVTGSTAPNPASSSLNLPSLSSLSGLLAAVNARTDVKGPESGSVAHDPHAEAEREYERAVLAVEIPLTTNGIQGERPQVISFLYDQLPLQCKQCAQRFPEDAHGKKRYEDHLDLHFRQNLRNATASTSTAPAGIGRGFTRSWFVGKQDWVTDATSDSASESLQAPGPLDKGKGRASSPSASGPSAEQREAKLKASFVIVPPGDEAKTIKCLICKEPIHAEFMEEDEEWVWKGAVSVKGKVYHATCHADAVSANLARLRHDGVVGTGRSRSVTPDATSLSLKQEGSASLVPKRESPSPRAGVKRKAEDDDSSSSSGRSRSGSASQMIGSGVVVKIEQTDSPRPPKKLALTPA